MAEERNTLYCSFCGKSQYEVKKLIAGPTVFICDECVVLCLEILIVEKFQSIEGLSREQQIFRDEQRIQGLVELVKRVIKAEEARSRPYDLLKEELEKLETPNEPPKVESSTSNDKESL